MGLSSQNSGVAGSAITENKGNYMAIAAFTAVAWYNILELNTQVFLTFKRHRGLYFWSLLISGYGCVLHALGFLLKFFQLTTNNYVSVTIITIGWYAMVTGQAVVLYSRLHLVVREQRILRAILAMIIVDAICFHIPTTILTYGANSEASNASYNKYLKPFNVVEKLQMTAFCIQEFIISGVYVWSTLRLLRPVYHGRTRKVMMQLIWINLIIIAMDVCLLAMEYANVYYIEATLKAMVYSIKLKLEFAVLNQLMTLANSSVNSNQVLHIEEDGEKPMKTPAGRSKSTEYISNKYEKPSKRSHRSTAQDSASAMSTTSTPPQPARHSSYGAYGKPSQGHSGWIPSFDRNCVVQTKHVENAASPKGEPELNVYNNPAAHFPQPKRSVPHDKYGVLDEEEDEDAIVSPALTGNTIINNPQIPPKPTPPPPPSPPLQHQQSPPPPPPLQPKSYSTTNITSTGSLRLKQQLKSSSGRRRAPPPPSLDLETNPIIMPNGLIRSNRPSVSEWGRGPDSETSPASDEIQLNPYDERHQLHQVVSPKSPGSVRVARERAAHQTAGGMDFMTSALR